MMKWGQTRRKTMTTFSWVLLFWGLLCFMGRFVVDGASGSHVVARFSDPEGGNATVNNHLIVHKETGIIYMGSVNRIYQLDPNLRLIALNKTGPADDSVECSGYQGMSHIP